MYGLLLAVPGLFGGLDGKGKPLAVALLALESNENSVARAMGSWSSGGVARLAAMHGV